jgi:CRP-like cAMP-binding protein
MSAQLALTKNSDDLLLLAQTFVPLCALKPNYLRFLLDHASVDYVCAGQSIFPRGVADQRHIYLMSGQVSLAFASGFTELITDSDGCYPLVNEMPRPCDALADTDCTLLIIDSDRLDRILSWSQIAEYLLQELDADLDSTENVDWVRTVIDSNLFYKVPPVNAECILDKMKAQPVRAGEVIIRQGEIGHCCYFIKEGTARVTARPTENSLPQLLADVGPGRCFGEDALVYETLRNATVTMTSDGVLMRLDKSSFKLLLVEPDIDEVDETDTQDLLAAPLVYIDVRTQPEYDLGHLAFSANIPLNLLALKLRLLRKDVAYVFYCDTGRRSRAAAFLLKKQGYQAAALRGGLVGAGMQYQLIDDDGYILRDGRISPT